MVEWCKLIELEKVPVLYRGAWDEKAVKACWRRTSVFGKEQEGYVVRNAESFRFEAFRKNTAKFVRADHVTTNRHWIQKRVTPNRLGG